MADIHEAPVVPLTTEEEPEAEGIVSGDGAQVQLGGIPAPGAQAQLTTAQDGGDR